MAQFHRVYSESVKLRIKELHTECALRGDASAFLSALKEIDSRLAEDPREFGEALYELPNARLQVRHCVYNPLAAYWAVHETQDIVFLKDFKLLPRSV